MTSARPRGRRPGTTDTRAEILDAARELFAAKGYERASMRAIAARAKVDPSLIVHYFASKEGLLRESLTLPLDPRELLSSGLADVPDEEVGEELVRVVLGVWEQPAVRSRLLSLLRTAVSHDLAMAVLRQMLLRTVVAAVARLVDDDSAQMRAELVATQMAGLAMARYLTQLPSIASASVDELAVAIGPSVQRYLTEEI
ncbi:MAG: TetR family transcriptional regulator [Jiangellales bacterium]